MTNSPYPSTKRILLIYLGSIFTLSWLLQVLAYVTTGDINSESAENWLVATMFVPTILTIVLVSINKSFRSTILWRPNKQIWVSIALAIVVPTIIAFTVVVLVQLLGFGKSGWFTFSTHEVVISGGPFVLGIGHQGWPLFTTNIVLTAVVYSLLNAIPAAGEEFAWRGFVQGFLVDRFGNIKGIIILGLMWSLWHLPAQLTGYNYPDHPIVGSLLISPLELIAVSLFWLDYYKK